ncbi:MAG: hypothetical protein ACRD4J_03170, partial [Nitrososphaeraceae archaeon]
QSIHSLIGLLCVDLVMGRWDSTGIRFPNTRRSYIRIAKYVIIAGFIIVAVVVLSVFIPRSGLNVEIIERSEVMGTMQTVSVKISNNNFGSLNNVEVRFDDQERVQPIGDMGPFSSVMITPPDPDNLDFDRIIVTANDGEVEVIKSK